MAIVQCFDYFSGMEPYSDDLRERVAGACAEAGRSVGEVAAQFCVSVSFVHKRRRQRTTGSLAALPHRGGPAPLLDAAAHAYLAAEPDATLAELRVRLVAEGGPAVGQTTAWKALQALDLRRKKRASTPPSATPRVRGLRRTFIEAVQHEDVSRFKFVDETSVNLTYTRRYGRAVGGRRVDQAVPLHTGPNVTVVAALTPGGVEAVMELDGAMNTASFVAYIEQVLGPTLAPGDVVVLDNLRVHKAPGVAEAVAAFGARLLFLPPYSPDFTPIELAFSKLKTALHTAQARTRQALTEALRVALNWISQADAKNWFHHCGYHVH